MNIQLLELLQSKSIISMDFLKEKLQFSERKIREMLKELREDEEKNGFQIVTVSKRGYFLQVIDEVSFSNYLKKQNSDFRQDVGRKDYRISLILFLLLQNSGFISFNQIAEILDVSRSTVINDMEEVKKQLKSYNITLDSRSHYGIKILGQEKDIRQMLSKISGNVVENQTLPLEFFEFIEQLDFTEETDTFISLLNQYNIIMTNNAIESILFHLKILIYRIMQNNFINEININRDMIDDTIYAITNEMISFIEKRHGIEITEDEIDLVASQIFGKASSGKVPQEQKLKMETAITKALEKVDLDYDTSFIKDEILIENLLLHIYPLIMRVSFGLSLSDSLIGSISVQYMNSFLVAMRFIDYHEELHNYELSRDEIGYLALHFATHIERENQTMLQKIKKVLLVVDNMRSSTMFIKTKLQSFFPFATILVIPYTSVERHSMEDIELIISTVKIEIPHQRNKIVVISERVDEQELRKIKNKILFSGMEVSQRTLGLQDMFYEDLFMVREDGDYFSLIEEMCEKMISVGYAQPGFTASVLERESRFSTIYDNGIASPHSLMQMANTDSIGVILLKNPITHSNKEIRCIFVLNMKKGHLLLHQEISDFVVRLMRDRNKVKLLQLVNTYSNFKIFIKDYL